MRARCRRWCASFGDEVHERDSLAGGDRPAMKLLPALATLTLLSACATISSTFSDGDAAPPGTLVEFGRTVSVGNFVVRPIRVLEDSRCPENAHCIEAGRLVVETRIEGPGWHETAPLVLGERHMTHATEIVLVSGVPERQAGRETPVEAYRFAFDQVRQLSGARLGERVLVDGPAVTPLEVLEDSRCPADVQCAWAGRLRIRTAVHLGSGDQRLDLTLGEPMQVADGMLELVEVQPVPATAGSTIAPADYRFTFRFDGGF
jgi:hypothetical protein